MTPRTKLLKNVWIYYVLSVISPDNSQGTSLCAERRHPPEQIQRAVLSVSYDHVMRFTMRHRACRQCYLISQVQKHIASFRKAEEILGFSPAIAFDTGLKETIDMV